MVPVIVLLYPAANKPKPQIKLAELLPNTSFKAWPAFPKVISLNLSDNCPLILAKVMIIQMLIKNDKNKDKAASMA